MFSDELSRIQANIEMIKISLCTVSAVMDVSIEQLREIEESLIKSGVLERKADAPPATGSHYMN